jgi:hypothetical protein
VPLVEGEVGVLTQATGERAKGDRQRKEKDLNFVYPFFPNSPAMAETTGLKGSRSSTSVAS